MTPGKPRRSAMARLKATINALAPTLAVAAFVQPAASLAARLDWRLDLFAHLQAPALALTLAASAAALATRRKIAIPLLLLAAFQVEPLARYSLSNPVRPAQESSARLKILMANIYVDNPDAGPLAALIRRESPDVIGLVEVPEGWLAGLSDVAREYPHRFDFPDGPAGLSLWFKAPPLAVDPPRKPTVLGWPYLRARFEFAGEARTIWLVHPASPFRRWGAEPGFPELAAIGRVVASARGSRVVVGDMNTTDGSPYFRDFLRVSGLRDSRLGFGRQVSWPVGSPVQIALDHAFVSADLAVTSRRLGPAIGSDHRPVVVELGPAASASKASAAQRSASAR